jgi:hypothetical protein
MIKSVVEAIDIRQRQISITQKFDNLKREMENEIIQTEAELQH